MVFSFWRSSRWSPREEETGELHNCIGLVSREKFQKEEVEQQSWESRRAQRKERSNHLSAWVHASIPGLQRGPCASSAKYWWALKREEFPEAGEGNTPPHPNEIILEAHPKPGTLHTLAKQSGKLPNSQASGRYSRSGNNYFQTKGCSGLTRQSQPCKNPTPSLMPEPVLWPHPIPLEQETIPGTSPLV